MREKLVQFFGGIIIYFIFGIIMVFIAGKGIIEQWPFILFWTMGMAIVHTFVMEPLRIRMTKTRDEKQKKKI